MTEQRLSFNPSHDERTRQGYVGAIKGYTNMIVQADLEQAIESQVVAPTAKAGSKNTLTRKDIEKASAKLPLYSFWSNLTFHSQDMLFKTVGDTVQRTK